MPNRMLDEVICAKHLTPCPFDEHRRDYVCPLCIDEKLERAVKALESSQGGI